MKSKTTIFYMLAIGSAVALTACAKGFKTDEVKLANVKKIVQRADVLTCKNDPASAAYSAPKYQVQISNSTPLLNFMTSQNSNVLSILNDPTFMGPPALMGRLEMTFQNLTLGNTANGGNGSQIRFQGVLSAGCSAEVRLESNEAVLSLQKENHFGEISQRITGYWKIRTATGNVTLAIDAFPVRTETAGTANAYSLRGKLYGAMGSADESVEMANFSIPLCAVMADTSWVTDVYGSPDPTASCAGLYP